MSDTPRDPSLEALGDLIRDIVLDSIAGSQPGIVTAYDENTQIASVRPVIPKARITEDDVRSATPQPEIHGVPVLFWGPARGRITWPVDAGDTCMLLHTSCFIGKFLRTGRVDDDPKNDRRHDVNDCVAIVAEVRGAASAPKDAIVTHGATRLGDPAADDPVALKSDLQSLVDGLDARIVVLTAGLPGTATELATVQAIKDALPIGFPVCATLVTAK